jgi:hypothetical protein
MDERKRLRHEATVLRDTVTRALERARRLEADLRTEFLPEDATMKQTLEFESTTLGQLAHRTADQLRGAEVKAAAMARRLESTDPVEAPTSSTEDEVCEIRLP